MSSKAAKAAAERREEAAAWKEAGTAEQFDAWRSARVDGEEGDDGWDDPMDMDMLREPIASLVSTAVTLFVGFVCFAIVLLRLLKRLARCRADIAAEPR